MSRTGIRSSVAAVAVLAVAVAPAATAACQPAVAASRYVLAVGPTFDAGRLPSGAVVESQLRAVHAVVVRAPLGSISWLIDVPGVLGVTPDRPLHVTDDGSDTAGDTSGVFAPTAVGGAAGTRGAGRGVTVAVVDTGVADTKALSRADGHLVSGPDFSADTSGVRDGFGHGTFMANLIAGGRVAGDAVGVAPGATVIDVKVAAADGSTMLSQVLSGLNWVARDATNAINVLSLSLSANRPQDAFGQDPLTQAVEAVRTAGITPVVSAGNDPGTVGDPGQDPYVMTVGAADTTGASPFTAPFSGHAIVARLQRPDVVAPGVSILSVLPAGSAVARAHPTAAAGHGLYRGSGTSQATAVTAGAVAVFLGQQGAVSPDDVRVSFAKIAQPLGTAAGAGLISIPTGVAHAADNASSGAGGAGTGGPPPGNPSTSSSSWSSSSWSSSSWSSSSWSASSWSSSSWSASSWSSSSWSSSSWSSSSWSSSSWSSSSWSASSWSAAGW